MMCGWGVLWFGVVWSRKCYIHIVERMDNHQRSILLISMTRENADAPDDLKLIHDRLNTK